MGRLSDSGNKIGLLGGTFDPPHLGHLILAEEALVQLGLDFVLFLLTPFPPHKTDQEVSDLIHRLRMLELAIHDNPCFRLSRIDIDRPPPHYAVDTLMIVKEVYRESNVIYLMGEDSLRDLPRWYQPSRFLQNCDGIAVMRRAVNGDPLIDLEDKFSDIHRKVVFLNAPRFDISSREIRQRVLSGLPFRYFLPPLVYQYICEQRLYR